MHLAKCFIIHIVSKTTEKLFDPRALSNPTFACVCRLNALLQFTQQARRSLRITAKLALKIGQMLENRPISRTVSVELMHLMYIS